MTKDSQRFLLFLWSQLVALLRWLVARWPRKSLAASPEKPSVQAASEASPKSDLLTEDAAVSSAPQDWIAKSYNAALDERRNDELKKDALVLATADLKAAFAALMLTKEIPLPVIVNYRFKMSEPSVAEAYRLAMNDPRFMSEYKERHGFSGLAHCCLPDVGLLSRESRCPGHAGRTDERIATEGLAFLGHVTNLSEGERFQ